MVRAVLRQRGHGDVAIAAPRFEVLPWELNRRLGAGAASELFGVLLAGDAAYALPVSRRAGFVHACVEQLVTGGASSLDVPRIARLVAESAGGNAPDAVRRLALVGEWPWVYVDELTGELWDEVAQRGYRLARMPLSEFFWMMWQDEWEQDSSQGSRSGVKGMPWEPGTQAGVTAAPAAAPSDAVSSVEVPADPFAVPADELADRAALLDAFRCQMAALSTALENVLGAGSSSFAVNPGELIAAADAGIPRFRGAGARYRFAKVALERLRSAGVVTVASMYENVDTILRLKADNDEAREDIERGGAAGAPVLRLAFDGTLDTSNIEKLRSYLYYI